MTKLKLIKKIVIEVLQWLAFALPIFVTGQRFATVDCKSENNCTGDDDKGYWLLVAGVIAYVAGITLVVWLPVKIFIVWKKVLRPFDGLWFPGNMLYIFFSAVPCVALVILGHERCDDHFSCFDYFHGAPIDTFVIMLVVTDWLEKLKCMKMRSEDDTMQKSKHTSSTSGQRQPSPLSKGTANVEGGDGFNRTSAVPQTPRQHPSKRNRTFRQRLVLGMKWTDARPEILLRDFLLAFDARILLGLSLLETGNDEMETVFETSWLYPIYIFSAISFLPLLFAPKTNMRSSLTVFLQDIPFFVFRVAIFSYFGSELILSTSVLFLLKNFFVALAFCYFNILVPRISAKQQRHEYNLGQLSENPNVLDSNVQDRKVNETEVSDRNQNSATTYGHTNPDPDSHSVEISSL